jgi:tryptophan 2,3-dioxygenase
MLTRVARIFEQLNSAWDVLRTMTPSEYTQFRPYLGASSGFQSYQYRLIEYLLGNRIAALTKLHEHTPEPHAALVAEMEQPSLYQVAIDLLCERMGAPSLAVYEDPTTHWELYELAEKLVDLEDYFRRWRFNHVTTVERIIGFKRGTGGTSGVTYLRKMLEVELFPELWHVRGAL